MNSKIFFVLLALFFLLTPLLYSLLFSSSKKGVIRIEKNISAPFLDVKRKFTLLFFGYVGCEDVCTPILQQLHNLHDSDGFTQFKKDVSFVFVNLTPEIDPAQADLFAKFFDTSFEGIYLSKKELFSIQRDFALYFSQDISDKMKINHTDYVYLLETTKQGLILHSIYATHPFMHKELLQELSVLQQKETI
jgi:protein SCO1/2